ncbi:unnamed protein product [Didymodactylos carnosus]|uniref:Uncharacterized protein n=1 Tax=Didymodactylos carnosus TaxID=1234261 RepID=A0A8S2T3L6_9BILA|nr:unnamed protein product [Didymodactylos carnosus]CAF4265042.1 unnamed protein product [Didymodactylos carnosus]
MTPKSKRHKINKSSSQESVIVLNDDDDFMSTKTTKARKRLTRSCSSSISDVTRSKSKCTKIRRSFSNTSQHRPLDPIVENQRTNEIKEKIVDEKKPVITIDTTMIMLANGKIPLTNYEEKYLLDNLLLKKLNKLCNIEEILEEQVLIILKTNFNNLIPLFSLNKTWCYDFLIKHLKYIMDNSDSTYFNKILDNDNDDDDDNDDNQDRLYSYKRWQLITLVREHNQNRKKQLTTTTTTTARILLKEKLKYNVNLFDELEAI